MTDVAVAPPPNRGSRKRRVRPGLVDLYLIRGVAGTFLLILVAVCVAMMLERALRLIQEMAVSGADIGYFLPLLAQFLPYYLDLGLPAAFMVALILLVARLDERLELEAMMASGLSMSRIAAPLLALGLAVGLAGLVTGGWLEPYGRYNSRTLHNEALNAGQIGRLQPRAFYHPAESLAVTFDRRAADSAIGGIFVWQLLADGREQIITSRSGRIGFVPRERLFGIEMNSGLYVAERPGAAGASPYRVAFDSLVFRESLQLRESHWRRGWDQNEMTLPELAAALGTGTGTISRRAIEAEYYSRISRAAILPLLPLLVLPLAFATKKGRRALGIMLCGAILAVIHHGLNFVRSLALGGMLDPRTSILGATTLCAAITLLVFLTGRHLPSHSPISGVLKPIGETLARFTPREQALLSVRGRTIATYLAWQLGKWTLMALVGIVALLQMVDLFQRGEAFVERGMGLVDVGRYALLRLPPMVLQALPLAALAGAMATFADFGRSHEMTAIRAAGVSQWRVLAMAMPVPLLLSLASFLLADQVVPTSQQRFVAWWAASEPARKVPEPQARWFHIGGEIVRVGTASVDGRRLSDVRIFRRDSDGLLTARLAAGSATAERGRWMLAEVDTMRLDSGRLERSRADFAAWATPLQPSDVAAFFSSTASLSSTTARRSLDFSVPVSQSESLFATRLYRSVAEPLAPMLMLLLALPLAFLAPQSKAKWLALLYAGGGGLLFLVADGLLTVAGQVGYLPAAVGAWAAPVMAALIGLTVLLYSER